MKLMETIKHRTCLLFRTEAALDAWEGTLGVAEPVATLALASRSTRVIFLLSGACTGWRGVIMRVETWREE